MIRYTDFFGKRGRVTELVLVGTIIVAVIFTGLLLQYDIASNHSIRLRTLASLVIVPYTLLAYFLLRKGHIVTASWLVIALYQITAALTLLYWGLNTPVGIIATCFSVVLPSILLGSRSVLPVALITILVIFGIQLIHTVGILKPAIDKIQVSANFIDSAIYALIFGIFALVSWIASRQVEATLRRAQAAEGKLRTQMILLEEELENESETLRRERFNRAQQLHRFAILGQSTTALLHDLSNRLSILSLDIDDLNGHYKNSASIMSTQETINGINQLMRSSKEQLGLVDNNIFFNPYSTATTCIGDLQPKFERHRIKFKAEFRPSTGRIELRGSEYSFMHAVEILLNNAIEACLATSQKSISLKMYLSDDTLQLEVIDTGVGIQQNRQKHLFRPGRSLKTSGLGIGLYLARELMRNNFNGDVTLRRSSSKGSSFLISLPLQPEVDPLK